MVEQLKRVKVLRHAKFGRNRSNHGGDMAIFGFSKMAAVRHLRLVMRVFGPPQRAFGGLYHCAKFGWNRYSSFDNMQVLLFRDLGLKMPIHAPKIGVFGGFDPLNGEAISSRPPKGTSLRGNTSYDV